MALVFAVMHSNNILIFLIAFAHFHTFEKSGFNNLTEGSTIPTCPSLMCCF